MSLSLGAGCTYSAEFYTNKAHLKTEIVIIHGLSSSLYSCLWKLQWRVDMFEGTGVTKTNNKVST